VVDEKGVFRDDNFNKAVSVLGDNVDLMKTDKKKRRKPTEGAELYKIVKMIVDKKFDPVIVFSFSKKEVEGYAIAMSKMDLTDDK
jgi:ATP-dependent RNA helicase DOB1